MTRKIIAILLFVILITAAILRLWKLGEVPISPDWDEVALGWNAYSIIETGKDEYGKAFPLILRSFDDYKPALYTYLTIPFIKLFGLEVFAVRLPAVIFGILAVFGTYLLVQELFYKYKAREELALIASVLLAISPWHIQFSRVAFESSVAVALNIFAVFLFLRGLRIPSFLSLSLVLMALNLYMYQGEKVFVPLLFLALAIIYRKDLLKIGKKYIAMAIVSGILVGLPMVFLLLTDKESLSRAQGVSIVADRTILGGTVGRLVEDRGSGNLVGQVFNNRRVVYAKYILTGYLLHFDLNWLFIKGDFDNNRHHAPNMGLLYLWELPLLFIGIYMLLFGPFNKTTKCLIFAWFLSSPIPASVTTGVPHAVRTLNFLPTWQIFTAIGIFFAMQTIIQMKYQIKFVAISLYVAFIGLNFSYYLNQYFVQQNYYHALAWQYGYKELVDYLKPIEEKYDKIIVSNSGEMSQSYMFFLFYLKYDPATYLAHGGTDSGGFEKKNSFSKYEFRAFDYYKDKKEGVLFVGAPVDFPEEFNMIKTIHYPDKTVAIRVVK